MLAFVSKYNPFKQYKKQSGTVSTVSQSRKLKTAELGSEYVLQNKNFDLLSFWEYVNKYIGINQTILFFCSSKNQNNTMNLLIEPHHVRKVKLEICKG